MDLKVYYQKIRDLERDFKADYAVVGDLHAILPAVTAEIRRRRDANAS
jgi:hypothetical protein